MSPQIDQEAACFECPATLFCVTGNKLAVLRCAECNRVHDIGMFDAYYRSRGFSQSDILSCKTLVQALLGCSSSSGALILGGHCPECYSKGNRVNR